MSEAYGNVAQTRLTSWDVTFNGQALGFCDKVSPDLKLITKDRKVGSLGGIVVGKWIIGLDGAIRCEFRETVKTLQDRLHPFPVSGSGAPLIPAGLHDLYDYAHLLLLHPRDVAGTTEDITLLKAVPSNPIKIERDGETADVCVVEFMPFPDRGSTGLGATPSVINYGYIGGVPT